jgi:hypothetical protein
MDVRCMKLAQKPKGFYISAVQGGGLRTLWVHSNGYSKKTHPSEYDAMEWLVQRGCPLKSDATEMEKLEAKIIRDAWLSAYGGEEAVEGKDTPALAEGEQLPQSEDSAEEEYEPVGTQPAPEAPPLVPESPSDAPVEISPTSQTAPLELSEPVLELEKLSVNASSSQPLVQFEDSSLRLPG